jgi:hypothetical protein
MECKGWHKTRNDHLATGGEDLIVLLTTARAPWMAYVCDVWRRLAIDEHQSSAVSSFLSFIIVDTSTTTPKSKSKPTSTFTTGVWGRTTVWSTYYLGMGCECADILSSCALASFD